LDLSTPFFVVMTSSAANFLLDEIFMFRMRGGIAGCGWASVLSQVIEGEGVCGYRRGNKRAGAGAEGRRGYLSRGSGGYGGEGGGKQREGRENQVSSCYVPLVLYSHYLHLCVTWGEDLLTLGFCGEGVIEWRGVGNGAILQLGSFGESDMMAMSKQCNDYFLPPWPHNCPKDRESGNCYYSDQ
jgi:hypothetical protein